MARGVILDDQNQVLYSTRDMYFSPNLFNKSAVRLFSFSSTGPIARALGWTGRRAGRSIAGRCG